MPELQLAPQLAQIVAVAERAGVGMTDWSMALEPDSLSFFDGILSGMYGRRNYYLKEDLIYEMLAHLREREPPLTATLRRSTPTKASAIRSAIAST
jgi:hypothetical protein